PGIPITVPLAPFNPGVFTTQNGDPIIVNFRTGRLASVTEPATPGDVLIIYSTGLGPVNPAVAGGVPSPGQPVSTATAPITVRFGPPAASPLFAGLAPGLVGVFQVNVQTPQSIPVGPTDLSVEIAGTRSNVVQLPVSNR